MLKIEVFSHIHQIKLLGVPDVVRNILEHLQSHLFIRILHNYPNNQPNYPNNQPKYSKMCQKSGFLTKSMFKKSKVQKMIMHKISQNLDS